ncbi:protein mono-ADP-ribosyltransferase PARP14 isoform X3 [Maylandia zebra]|uniref:protein mono-ADP-ribosyltransferase PARP14 isoform X3 n=1 Tax=Maylandia zebra TaxID=106582 RepID=UPI00403CE095
MEGSKCPPVIVEGDWTPAQTKALKNKLQIYFMSRKKSGGGDCQVEAEEGAPRAAVYFNSVEVRERVLARKDHVITLDSQTIQLWLSSAASPTCSDDVSDSSMDTKKPQAEPGNGAAAASKEDSELSQSCAVVLENVTDNMSTDLLSMLVENISGLDENGYSMERILESNKAVVTFSSPADVERFLSVSQSSTKMKKQRLTARPLEAATNIRVESPPLTVVKDSESSQSCAVVLENVTHNMSTDLLSMLVENISGLDENGYSMERILESNKAVVTFGSPADVERFLSVSQTSTKMKKQGLTARPLEAATNIQVESPPLTVVKDSESSQSCAVVLENVTDNMSTDLLSMLVENISGLDENGYSMERILESNKAVVTFSSPADVERFLSVSQSSTKMKKQGLTARPLEAATNIRVESLPPTVVKDMLELYFENWNLPDNIIMIPAEQAAIITFSDPKVVEKICIKKDLEIKSVTVKVYPYYKSLGTALYGKERPTWKMPDPFTEHVHHVIWKFLVEKKLSEHINDQMRPHFCRVDLNHPNVKLSPVPEFLRQQGLTAEHVDNWMNKAQHAFHRLMSQYTAFICQANAQGWTAAEKDVRSIVKEDAILVLDASQGVLTVAGRADRLKKIKAPVEKILLKAMGHIERQTNSISEEMILSPAMFYILNQEGLHNAALNVSPEMKLSYDESTQKLTIRGLPAEVYKTKSWISEKIMNMSKKHQSVPPCLLDFLRTLDPMDLSQDLFTSQGISAIYTIDNKSVLLFGSSDRALVDAESKMKTALAHQIVEVEDQKVLKLPTWGHLKQKLLDTYNLSKKKTVAIEMHPERRNKITVAGFVNPVKEVSHSLKEFIASNSQVQETLRLQFCAVVLFIKKKKSKEWSSIVKDNDVSVRFYVQKQSISILGARLNVQKAKSCFMELASALFTDTLTVDKPGAKKYFQNQGKMLLSTLMNEIRCAVFLRPEIEDDEEEEAENYGGETNFCYCKVQTNSGVLISVSKVDICSFGVDAVVNAANEDLDHIGGLALALLKAAGPQLQKESSDYVAKNGRLRPGDAIITDAYNLPCKHVVHAVGPRFSDFDKKTAVSRLKTAVRESLRQAEMANCSSIALPAISSGIFGFPVDLCAETIAQAVREHCDSPQGLRSLTEIHLVDNNDTTVRVMATAVSKEFSDLGPTMTIPQQAGGKRTGASGRYQWSRGRGQNQSHSVRWFNEGGRGGEPGRGGGGGRGGGFRGNHQGNRGGWSPKQHTSLGEHGGLEQTTAKGLKIILCKGNIQDQTTDAIVNTISEDMNLNQGAVSKAILSAAGSSLQDAIYSAATGSKLPSGNVVVTDGYNLTCQKVFHAVCPSWDNGGGKAEEELMSIIRYCLEEAEKRQMASLSFPAIGTGNLSFPRALVSKLLLREIRSYSSSRNPRCLREVVIVVHPSDSQTVDCFTRGFTAQGNVQHEARGFHEVPAQQAVDQSQRSSASSLPVLPPSLGVYQKQIGQLTLEVSSGDITKESTDVIVNSSNQNFSLKAGVSKAILDGAGVTVEQECAQLVSSTAQPPPMILTSAGQLPSRNIVHVVGQNDPASIKNTVYSVLKVCEENKFSSVTFPALGTGKGGVSPSTVADAMVDAVMEFVEKKQPSFVQSVRILIFQTTMLTEFHTRMEKRQGEVVEEKTVVDKTEEKISASDLVLKREEFEPIVLQLCADNHKAASQAKKRIIEQIRTEQAQKTISDPCISQLSQADMEKLKALQRELTVSIRLDKGAEDQDPEIHLEGLTRDVYTAESAVRDIIRKVERAEALMKKALEMSEQVEWRFKDHNGSMVAFDLNTNLTLEEAFKTKQKAKIKINNDAYTADPEREKAVSANGRNDVELHRKDLKGTSALPLPSCWEDMKDDLLKLFAVAPASNEYNDVKKELTKTGLNLNIISIERVQNPSLWQNYQIMKKQMEVKNKHTNNELLLFHGTTHTSIHLINKQGFNRSYAGKHGAMYGNGSYFAVDPCYSARNYATPDTSGHKHMYQARVLVGDYTQGQPGMITPPPKSGSDSDLYDSVTNNTAKPTMFVVFNDIQAYPEYLITFT